MFQEDSVCNLPSIFPTVSNSCIDSNPSEFCDNRSQKKTRMVH